MEVFMVTWIRKNGIERVFSSQDAGLVAGKYREWVSEAEGRGIGLAFLPSRSGETLTKGMRSIYMCGEDNICAMRLTVGQEDLSFDPRQFSKSLSVEEGPGAK